MLAAVGAIVYMLASGMGAGRQTTAILHKEKVGNQHQGQAVIVRDERLVDAESITNIDFIAEEGELVNGTPRSARCIRRGTPSWRSTA